MIVAYLGLALVGVGLFQLFASQSNEQARRVAIQRAAAQAQVTACGVLVKNGPIVDGFVKGQKAIIRNQILSTIGALAATPRADPLYEVRKESLRRLNEAFSNTTLLAGLVAATTPSRGDCNALARRLEVAIPFPRQL